MNIASNSEPCTVRSRYFCKEVMDESLSEFKEKKRNCTGPKNSKPLSKTKSAKRIKGQKDIRTALKSKKNDLVNYTKDFDNVCKKSGIDVDSEQLQLAIALSKSLQTKPNDDADKYVSLTSQERTNKIRTTLQEYGFKVPEIKIASNNRKIKKPKRHYKLLTLSDSERKELISNKYSLILEKNVCEVTELINTGYIDNLYYKATSIEYKYIKNNDIFYINDLIGRTDNKLGSLLSDWSAIPGRPSSPTVCKEIDINFTDIELPQSDLDVILSGTIDASKEIFNKISLTHTMPCKEVETSMELHNNIVDKVNPVDNSNVVPDLEQEKQPVQVIDDIEKVVHFRSYSPDIFDDEESVIINTENNDITIQNTENDNTPPKHEVIDLTQCISINLEGLSQTQDKTKRISNDFMEITNCATSQPIKASVIDISQNSDDNLGTKIEEVLNDKGSIDLTQSSNSNDDLPFVDIGKCQDSLNNTIIMNENEYTELNETQTKHTNYNTEEDAITNSLQLSFFDDYNHDHSYEETDNHVIHYINAITETNNESGCNINDKNGGTETNDENVNIDLTQSSNSNDINDVNSSAIQINCLGKADDVSIDYDDVMHQTEKSQELNTEDITIKDDEKPSTSKDTSVSDYEELEDNSKETSQNSGIFEISDKELDYSIHRSKVNFNYGNVSTMDDFPNDVNSNSNLNVTNELPSVDVKSKDGSPVQSSIKSKIKDIVGTTPNNSKYVIKTAEVTPISDYASMSTPEVHKELDRYGLKRFKRKRAIQLLTHLYNQTHPTIETCEEQSPSKKPRTMIELDVNQPKPLQISPKKSKKDSEDNAIYEETKSPDIRHIECIEEDWIFQKKEKTKVHSCRVPLHIAFHNYVTSRRFLREAILRYEPVNIDVIHKGLVKDGHRYDPKDLLKFMDKKCITVKTADNSRNK